MSEGDEPHEDDIAVERDAAIVSEALGERWTVRTAWLGGDRAIAIDEDRIARRDEVYQALLQVCREVIELRRTGEEDDSNERG